MKSNGVAAVVSSSAETARYVAGVDLVIQPLAQRPVADSIVILDVKDEIAGATDRSGRCLESSPGESSTHRRTTSPD